MTLTVNPYDPLFKSFLSGEAPARRPADVLVWFNNIIRKPILDLCGVYKDDKKGIFGTVLGFAIATEFQGNGLPHLHLVLWLQDRELLKTGVFM